MRPTDIISFDRVMCSGYCLSEGRFFYRLTGVICGVYRDQIKLWPDQPIGDQKLWFVNRTLRIHKHERTL